MRLIFLFFLFPMVIWGQAITVTGEFKESYRWVRLSSHVERVLFVLEKGDFLLPERGYFLKLSEKDAQRLDTSHILVIPLFGDEPIKWVYDTPITFELYPLPGTTDDYYCKKASYMDKNGKRVTLSTTEISIKSSMQLIQEGKPFLYGNFISENREGDYRDLAQWIDALDSPKKVKVTNTSFRTEIDEKGRSSCNALDYVEYESLSDLAKIRMESIREFVQGFLPIAENPTKEDWKAWLKRLYAFKLPIINTPSHITYLKEARHYEPSFYTLDAKTKQIHVLHSRPNMADTQDKQVFLFDTQNNKVTRGVIFTKEQYNARYFNTAYAQGGNVYTFSDLFMWGKYTPIATDSLLLYKQIDLKHITPDPKEPSYEQYYYVSDVPYKIEQTHSSKRYMYALYHKKDSREYEVMCIETLTGKLVGRVSVNELLGDANSLKYHMISGTDRQDIDSFAVLMETNKGIYHLLFEGIKLKEKVLLGERFMWACEYLHWDDQSLYGDINADEAFKFSTIASPSEKLKIPSGHYMGNGFLVADGDRIVAFYTTREGFFYKLRQQFIDRKSLSPIGSAKIIYQYLPVEQIDSDNSMREIEALKLGNTWHVFFTIKKKFHWTTTND